MSIDTPAPARRRSWLPDRNAVRITCARVMLTFGVLCVAGGAIGAVSGYRGSTPAFLATLGTVWIALAAFEVARPTTDRGAVVVYRLAFFSLPVAAYVAFLLGDR